MSTGPWPPADPQPGFSSPLAQSPLTPPEPVAPAPVSPAALPALSRKGRSAPIWIFGVLVFALIALVGYFLNALGPSASVVGALLALVPLAGVLLAVRIVDRWEPEPRGLLVLAAAWGAIAAIGIALGVDLLVTIATGGDASTREVFSSVVQAPLVEEFAKGLGVFLIFASARRAFDGPVDGIVYGALVGAGFAFTENIQYFAISLIEGGVADVSQTFFLRGILSPFAHVMFTSITGFAVGLAARRGATTRQAVGPWVVGMLGAAALHAFWNGSAVFTDFFRLYVTAQVPLFLLFVFGIVALRREESRLTRARLAEYADAGWFTPQEVDMLATGAGRRAALAWARTLRGDRTAVMKRFIADATALAMARQRALTGRDAATAQDERTLLERTSAARAALFAP
ncbi:PrsW family intramembrane metalloprotease [Microbacterium ulmi]|uniref:PrsW family intramembrane metalloprotease n=1 Tax=Microbacterium ulmi TaxID=179095 RepID=A0A7Y2M0G7_9MICO|nr:PrsW family intramembrane metalloprotease [Microbacterium ulmi]NII70568.1 RsiW-degrading membrane proteinase PrsW (M82 family) [Microbacterium ulmi]NNH04190.1 PrsW family intramembrane metalloprotease [Microbacterium ulmi]